MAREHGPEAIARLVHWMRSGDSQSSIAAAKILLDRGYGKSMQLLGSPNGAPLVNITMGNGAPISSAADAARVYAEIIGNPSMDLSGLRFEAPAPSAVVAEVPRNAAALPERVDARIAPIEGDTAATWEALSK